MPKDSTDYKKFQITYVKSKKFQWVSKELSSQWPKKLRFCLIITPPPPLERLKMAKKRSRRLFFSPLETYSFGHSLTYGYLISPMKMRSLWENGWENFSQLLMSFKNETFNNSQLIQIFYLQSQILKKFWS